MCDPPSGWRWGFPKPMPSQQFDSVSDLYEWLVVEGYPQKEIDYWKESSIDLPCRFWSQEIEI